MPPPLLVNTLEIGMFQQPPRTRKATRKDAARLRCGMLSTPLLSVGSHKLESQLEIQLTILHNSQ